MLYPCQLPLYEFYLYFLTVINQLHKFYTLTTLSKRDSVEYKIFIS
jgi:hypothetical protein